MLSARIGVRAGRAIRAAAPFAAVVAFATSSSLQAAEGAKASFLVGVWATADGCVKRAALLAGGPKNVETAPELLTADGYEGWEGGCTFKSIAQQGKSKWTVKTTCNEGAEDWEDTEAWEFDAAGTRLKVTVQDKTTEFVRCDGGKGN